MKIKIPYFIALAGIALSTNAHSATYPGQDCQARSGASLQYETTGARNTRSSTVSIACPLDRLKDGGTAAVAGVFYFVDDGKTKTCFLDNFNIDTGGTWKWTSRSGVRRLVLPVLTPTKAWSPLVFNCSLPPNSKVTGYYISE